MSENTIRKFDLNIKQILEGWEVCHAIREIIANALDEHALTDGKDVEINKDVAGNWHIRDYGRGLKYENLTQNENEEKLRNSDKVVGKFGVGLKDALATLHRRGASVRICSKYGDIFLDVAAKHDFSDVSTLHAFVSPPANSLLVGTDVRFEGISDADIVAAKGYFLRFSGEAVLETTRYGQILRRDAKGKARIYVKGLLVAEEDNFLFSYNITSLTSAMNKALNRERTNVGRTAYADRVKAMLLACNSPVVAGALADDLVGLEKGTSHDEVNWVDVAVHASQILNASEKVVFVSAVQRTMVPDAIDHAIADGYNVVTVPENIGERLRDTEDIRGRPVRDLEVYQREWAGSFEFKFVSKNELTPAERAVLDNLEWISNLAGGLPPVVREIRISETMRPDLSTGSGDPVGFWESNKQRIIIKRSQLRSLESFAATLLHEVTHARTGYVDVTREFEEGLTEMLGKISASALKRAKPGS